MGFKMAAKDLQMLAKYLDKKADGAIITVSNRMHQDKLFINVLTSVGDDVTITIYSEESNRFPSITTTRRLGDEL